VGYGPYEQFTMAIRPHCVPHPSGLRCGSASGWGSSWLLVETPIQFQVGVLSDVWECLVVGECIQVFADLDTVVVLGPDQGNMSLAQHTMQQCSDSMILSTVGYFTVYQLSLVQRSGPYQMGQPTTH